jgi:hypothetical protein
MDGDGQHPPEMMGAMIAAWREGNDVVYMVREARDVRGLHRLLRAAELYAERHGDADGRIKATFRILFLAGWAPHESQQKPLRPGSAKARLAEALGTQERPLKSTGED